MSQLRHRFRNLFSKTEHKASAVGPLKNGFALLGGGQARWTPRDYASFAREGYAKNVVAFACIRLVAESAAAVPWRLSRRGQAVGEHELLTLLHRPNPLQSGVSLMESFYGYLQIAGNAYLEAVENSRGLPGELYALRPDRMTVIPGPRGWPGAYSYAAGGRSHRFPFDFERGITPILHLRSFNPLDDHYGMSPLEAAAIGVDLHNAAGSWNKALLDNSARPSGALVFEGGDGGNLNTVQFERLREEMEKLYQTPQNAGRPLLLEGGLRWQEMGFSPKDMDFINAKHVAAREIALAFGVPPMILGIPGDNTYANYQEANRALWRQTILPLVKRVCSALNAWLPPKFGEDLALGYDADRIDALSHDRQRAWARVQAADFLTINEKRAAVGYEPIKNGDVITPMPTDQPA